jgi:hypothetical protein
MDSLERHTRRKFDTKFCRRNIRSVQWAGLLIAVAREIERGRKEERVQDLTGKPKRKRPLRRPRHRSEDSIKMDLRDIGCGGIGDFRSKIRREDIFKPEI